MDFNEWANRSFDAKDSFAERNDSFIVEVAKVGWDAAIKHSVPKIEWDEYAKSYVIELPDGRIVYWNP